MPLPNCALMAKVYRIFLYPLWAIVLIVMLHARHLLLKVHVDFTEQLGSETYFYCQGEGIKQLIVHHTGQYKINKGEELYLRFKRDSVHLFEENGMSVSKKNI